MCSRMKNSRGQKSPSKNNSSNVNHYISSTAGFADLQVHCSHKKNTPECEVDEVTNKSQVVFTLRISES